MGDLSREEISALEDFRDILVGRLRERIHRMTLFGSRARGRGAQNSDLDVLVLVHDATRADRRSARDAAADVSQRHSVVVSPLLLDAGSWQDHPLRAVIDREGRTL